MTLQKNSISDTVLFFLILFSFLIIPPYPLTSAMICLPFFVLQLLLSHTYRKSLKHILKSIFFFKIIIYIVLIISASFFIAAYHSRYVAEYSKTMVMQIVQIAIVAMFVAYVGKKKVSLEYYESLIVNVFIIQSIIQVIAFFIPSFARFIHNFYTQEDIELLYNGYRGVRGLALAQGTGLSLGASYGLAFIFYTKRFLIDGGRTLKGHIYGVILIIGMFFAGRIAYAGCIISIFYFLFSSNVSFAGKVSEFFKVLLYVGGVIVLILLIIPFSTIEPILKFSFEFLYSMSDGGQLETGSTNTLMKMWQAPVSIDDFFLGTGNLFEYDGSYFRHTDVGYLRKILYGGVFFLILTMLYQYHAIFNAEKRKSVKRHGMNALFVSIMTYMLIVEAKAMVISFNKSLMTIIIFYSFAIILLRKQKISLT